MVIGSVVKLAWRNVLQNRKKTMAALIAITSGFVSLNIFQGYIYDVGLQLEDTFSKRMMFGEIIVERSSADTASRIESTEHLFSKEEQLFLDETLAKEPNVTGSVRFLTVSGMATNGKMSSFFLGSAYDLEKGKKMREAVWEWNTRAGKPLDQSPEGSVVIGRTFGQLLGCEEEESHEFVGGKGGYPPADRPFKCHNPRLQLQVATVGGQANAESVSVAGITGGVFAALDQKFVAMPLEMGQRLMNTDAVSYVSIGVREPGQAQAVIDSISKAASAKGFKWAVRSWRIHPIADFYWQSMSFFNLQRNFFVAVILMIALLSVMNTVIRIVRERTREIGTLRSLGFKARDVRNIFLLESAFLAVLGIAVGVVVCLTSVFVINTISFPYLVGVLSEPTPFQVTLTLERSLESAGILVLVSVLAAIAPTERAVRQRIVQCLTAT